MEAIVLVLIVVGSVVGWVLRVVFRIWMVRRVFRHYSQLYQQFYLPQFEHFQRLLAQLQHVPAPQVPQYLPQAEIAFRTVNETFRQLPTNEQQAASPDLQRLRQQWNRLSA
jgi:hypothetical protein